MCEMIPSIAMWLSTHMRTGNDKGPITQKIIDVAVQYGFEDWLIMPGRIPHELLGTGPGADGGRSAYGGGSACCSNGRSEVIG